MNSENANQETVQVAAGLMQEAELSYANVVAENEQLKAQLATAEAQYSQLAADYDAAKKRCKKLNIDNAELKDKFEQEFRSKTELFMRYQEESNQILLREKELAIPEFHGSTVGFPRWVSWVTDLFDNYPQLTDFNKRMMIVDALKREARSWYDAEPDTSTTSWLALKEALLRQYGGTNSITIKLVTKDDDNLAVALMRQQIHFDIRRYLPEQTNESFESFEQRLRRQFEVLQGKPSPYPRMSENVPMDLDVISAPINRYSNITRPSSPSGFRPRSPNQSQYRNTKPHNSANTTMSPEQFGQYVQSRICFTCGKRGHLRSMCPNYNTRRPRGFNAVETAQPAQEKGGSNSMHLTFKPPKPPDKLTIKTVSFSDPPTTEIHTINASDPPSYLFASQLPYHDMPTEKLSATPLTTMTLHLNEDICFKLSASINDRPVSVLYDTGSQITSMTASLASKLNLATNNCEPLTLRLGDNSAGSTSDQIATASLCFGNTMFPTTFRLMTSQPYDVILGANFIVASKAAYDPTRMTISFTQGHNVDTFQMIPSGSKATEWAPLVLAASAVESLLISL
ncbi:hypothetical protein BB560_003852 [Smittium megazygosporum]|uniref:CCHC-type domain-containing protein n=1 Tax=Smittium megazygosporum TaxID=133381 RepID=A0A2T9ZAS5_9FUNG|nr:hypothetical protein BB560_003852 [Smittium megazygosporum]